MADWEEVKRLAADFQRAQLSVAKQRLSERNVIELVSKLVNLKLIDVIYTLDGKEYLTHQELYKEITDELLVNGGRINLVDLQQLLNVDFSHIESKASEIIKHEKNRSLVLGQLIDISYLDKIAEEVNDKLQDQGHVTIPELTKLYDLPADFLSEHIHHRVGKIIHGHVDAYDRDVIFTESFITRMKAQIRGTFSAITRPTVIQSIMSRHSFQERLFYSLLEDLVNKGRLAGSISGGRQEKALYIPNIYTKSQNEWVDSFYKQNGYLEYDSLIRLGIADPKSYIKRRFKDEAMTYLGTCCIGAAIKDQVEASVEEADTNDTWIDIMPVLPSIFSMEDVKQILTECSKKYPHTAVCCDTIVTSDKFIQKWNEPFKDLVIKKAEMRKHRDLYILHSENKEIQPTLTQCIKKSVKYSPSDPKQLEMTNALIMFIAGDLLPLSIVESEEFKNLMEKADTKYQVPSRKHLSSKLLHEKSVEIKNNLVNTLKRAESVCLTIDLWSSRQMRGFLGITGHFILDWAMKSVMICCKRFKGRHTAESIRSEYEEVVTSFEIGFKIAAIVSDNASNMVKAFSIPGFDDFKVDHESSDEEIDDVDKEIEDDQSDDLHLSDCLPKHSRCFAHTLQLVVKDGLKDCSPHLKTVITKASNIVSFVRKSIIASEILEDYKRLQAANATRWNSQLHMICSVLNVPELELDKIDCKTKLSSYERKLLSELCTILEPFDKATVLVQGEKNCNC
ncbi:UFL1 [Mytilus edulis]|uniref:UFL1 n=1 Tax=Mytilus edulis TaxID=6550 RepID=A0A8S3UB82_MYTED|nr:UFL1 [Mytilus edulis]